MPADNSVKERRTSRRAVTDDYPKSYNARQLEHAEHEKKRARGEIACAECFRLKQRCDKKVPCSSCIRRGCPIICPNGTLSSGQGARYVLADTEQLHAKLTVMSERIRQLESALEVSESARSTSPHPLLRDDLLAIKQGIEDVDAPQDADINQEKETDGLDAFGTLAISDRGISRFIGRSGGSESLLIYTAEEDVSSDDKGDSSLSDSLAGSAWPFKPIKLPLKHIIYQIKENLPTWERAWTLCETYLEQSSWNIRFVHRPQLIDELLSPIYKRNTSAYETALVTEPQTSECSEAQQLALLIMVFAMGALADLTLPPYNDEAEQYYQLACSLVNMETAAENPSLTAVQVLGIMGNYCTLGDRRRTGETAYSVLCQAGILGETIGLHRDPARWKLDPKIVQLRRHVFWQLYTANIWQALGSGRLPLFSLRYVDCEFPDDDDQSIDSEGKIEIGFWRWRFSFAKQIMSAANDLMCTVESVKYSDIMSLDRKVREFGVPSKLRIPAGGSDWEKDGPYLVMIRFTTSAWRDVILLYIHRSFFAKAMLDHPLNPLKSRYAPSFLTVYRSSLSLLKAVREHYELCPILVLRFYMVWRHVFSALIILGTVVMNGPNSGLAPPAIVELSLGIACFERAAEHAGWARRALVILTRLRDKAFHVYSQRKVRKPVGNENEKDDWEDELTIFGGLAHIITSKDSPRSRSTSGSSSAAFNTPSPPSFGLSPGPTNESPTFQSAVTVNTSSHILEQSPFYSQDLAQHAISSAFPLPGGDMSIFNWAEAPATSYPNANPPLHPAPSTPQQTVATGAYGFTNSVMNVPHQPYGFATFPPMDTESVALGNAVDWGLASGDSSMDEAWASFLQGTGLLAPENATAPNG